MTAEIHGSCEPRFEGVRETLRRNIESGLDIGASAAIVLDGELVCDLWGGHRDREQTLPWDENTIVNVFSTTKTMTFLCALILADRGELDLHAPVTRYWPEFGAAGKEAIEVRHLLGHSAGLSGWDEQLPPEALADWERCTSLLAAQTPWWASRDTPGYHAVTQGYLVGEVIRRISGISLGTFFRQEVAEPLGADFHIGTGPEHDARISPMFPPPPVDLAGEGFSELGVKTLTNPRITGDTTSEEWWRRAEIPAANGHGNARSVAMIQSVVACGGEAHGTRLLSREGVEALFVETSAGKDLVLGVPLRFGMGYGLSSETLPMGPHSCSWGGYGGSIIVNDLDARISIAYVMNRMEAGLIGDPRGAGVVMAAIAGLAGG